MVLVFKWWNAVPNLDHATTMIGSKVHIIVKVLVLEKIKICYAMVELQLF
jgi:hypothetical protein